MAVLYRAAGIEIVWPELPVLVSHGIPYFMVSLLRFRKVLLTQSRRRNCSGPNPKEELS